MTYAPAAPSRLSKVSIGSLAESVAQQLNFDPTDDIAEAVKRLGGKIRYETTLLEDPSHTGSLFVDDEEQFEIVVPMHTSPTRDRFTIAHELGHYIVHYLWPRQANANLPKKMKALRKDSDRVEWEANWFAASFLMPRARFDEAFRACNGNLDILSATFGVSRPAAEVRARSLGLIG